nr:YdiU family protein [Oceanococcus sp. HetDA_MAG_MS8]
MESRKLLSLPSVRLEVDYCEALPCAQDLDPHQSQTVPDACASVAQPEPVTAPELIAWSAGCASELGFAAPESAEEQRHWANLLSGNALLDGSRPYAMRYGGHQFGNWAGQLGDGRVINLGELRDARGALHTVQLKGAGRTNFSRGADGRAVLRSSLREYVLSEAMAALGVPTSRALALVSTGDAVVRDMLYDGHPEPEPGAIVTRVAPSFVRIGHFEIHAASGETQLLQQLLDYCLERSPFAHGNDAVAWFGQLCEETGRLASMWMQLGFVHGVLNTDNTSVLGLTIDYGPFGWLEPFDPGWTPNTTDAHGRRYAFGRQPEILQWNLGCLGSALMSTGLPRAALEQALQQYSASYTQHFYAGMGEKFGVGPLQAQDLDWLQEGFELLRLFRLDWTRWFCALGEIDPSTRPDATKVFTQCSYASEPPTEKSLQRAQRWWDEYLQRRLTSSQTPDHMRAVNPFVVPRNWLLAECIESAESGDMQPLESLMRALSSPFDRPDQEHYMQMRPAWAEHKPGCSMLSCSS